MRCPDCNKFVSFDSEQEPEVDVTVEGKEIVGQVRIANNCQECGQELKEANFDVSVEHEHDEEKCEGELEVEVESADRLDELQRTDRRGKPIKSMRYMKHLYGAECVFVVACGKCGFRQEVKWKEMVSGSGMEELV